MRASSCTTVLKRNAPAGGVERLGVPEIDLELAGGELMVGGDHVEPVRRETAQGADQRVLRVALEARGVDVPGALAVALALGSRT